MCSRTAISRAEMGVDLPIILPKLKRIFFQMYAKQENKIRESMFYVKKRANAINKSQQEPAQRKTCMNN